ncbi:MAG: nitroreductase/quinone reductase family protein [Blastocatellia bacterium]
MLTSSFPQIESLFFRNLNQFAEPLIRAGLGNPLLTPLGTIVVETTGRKTARKHHVPVLALRLGELIVFSTVRRDSQWVKNLLAHPAARYWLASRAYEATAYVITPGGELPAGLPAAHACTARLLQRHGAFTGVSFAMLTPRH